VVEHDNLFWLLSNLDNHFERPSAITSLARKRLINWPT
jgi:hypothetical protein